MPPIKAIFHGAPVLKPGIEARAPAAFTPAGPAAMPGKAAIQVCPSHRQRPLGDKVVTHSWPFQ